MMEATLRPVYQKLFVDPIAKQLLRLSNLSANAVSIASAALGLLVLLNLALQHPYIAIVFLLASGYLDTLDGTLARMSHTSSAKGTVLDIFCDRVVECSCLLGLFLVDPAHRGLWVLLMLSSSLLCITSFLVVGIFSENQGVKSFYYSPGLIERAEAFIFFVAMIALPSLFTVLALLYSLLVLWTALVRIYQFMKLC